MPAAIVAGFAKKTGKSTEEVEKFWKEIKADLLKHYTINDPKFYGTLVLRLKRKLGIKDALPFPLGKVLNDASKYRFDIKILDTLISKQLSKILIKNEIVFPIFAEYRFKSSKATVVFDVKGTVEFWIHHDEGSYVKKSSFKSEGDLIKIIQAEEKNLAEFSKKNDSKEYKVKGYSLVDENFVSVVDEPVTSGSVGPFIKASPSVGKAVKLTKRLVCHKCGFTMPKSQVIEPKSLSCPVCGTSMM